ncbi:MAG TPA: glycosyltransferase [Casimicrobiaceae bacterium]|nr:glycosyltransferase [Casimicrobiaceae bacterium]
MSGGADEGWRARLAAAQAALRGNDLAEAKRLIEGALSTRPGDADAGYLAAIVASRDGRPGEARAHLVAAVAERPAFAAAWLALGNAELALGDDPAAIAAFERATAQEPRFGEAHYNLGLARKRRGEWHAAAGSFLRALAAQPLLFDAGQQLVDTLAHWVTVDPSAAESMLEDRDSVAAQRLPSVSVIVCSIDDDKFRRVSSLYRRLLSGVDHQLIGIHDARSLAEAYNRALRQARGEVLIFSHDDIDILAADFAARLAAALDRFDLVGVAGATHAAGPAWSWAGHPHVHGWVTHRRQAADGWRVSISSPWPLVGGVHSLDGVFLGGWRRAFESVSFDAVTFDGFHGYDVDFSLRAARSGWRLGVCGELLLVHESEGRYDAEWTRYAERFRAKYPELADPPRTAHRYEAKLASAREATAFYRRLAQLARTTEGVSAARWSATNEPVRPR